MKFYLCLLLPLLFAAVARAGLHTEAIEYKHGDTVLEGYLAYDDATTGKRPGVLVVHEWYGHNPYARKRAEQLARLGYVAFALDMYGKGVLAKNPDEAGKLAATYKNDRKLMRARARAGLDVLLKQPQVDPKRVAAIGYCFGGTTALELARDGADIAGVVSFHGGLSTPTPDDARNIKAKVLALHGADDPFVKPEEVAAFEEEMRKGGVDWELVKYGDAVHSFTNPQAGTDKSRGAAYNEKADHRSWEAMKAFFSEIFK
jgi:dienelactone hydrolase